MLYPSYPEPGFPFLGLSFRVTYPLYDQAQCSHVQLSGLGRFVTIFPWTRFKWCRVWATGPPYRSKQWPPSPPCSPVILRQQVPIGPQSRGPGLQTPLRTPLGCGAAARAPGPPGRPSWYLCGLLGDQGGDAGGSRAGEAHAAGLGKRQDENGEGHAG